MKVKMNSAALAWSALAAGLSMGFSFIAEALLSAHLLDAPWRPLISRLGYCIGFLIVILGRQQIFTEATLTVILPLLLGKDLLTFLRVLRLWGVVLAANFVGTFLFATVIGHIRIFPEPVHQAFTSIGLAHLGESFGITFTRAIFAGSSRMLYLVVTRSISGGTYFTDFFFPTILGNIVGGVSLVAALGHAQVVGGKE